MKQGFVYVFYDPGAPRRVKIGRTERDPEARREELWSSGLAEPLHSAHYEWSPDCFALERLVHKRLTKYRIKDRREFFDVPIDFAIATVRAAAEEVLHLLGYKTSGHSEELAPAINEDSLRDTHLIQALLRKVNADCHSSPLPPIPQTARVVEKAFHRMEAILLSRGHKQALKALADNVAYDDIRTAGSSAFRGIASPEDHKCVMAWLKFRGEAALRLSIATNSAAAVAAAFRLRDWGRQVGYEVDVSCSEPAGIFQVLSAWATHPPFHCIVVGQPAFSFATCTAIESGSNDRTRNSYSLALPVHTEGQTLLVSTKIGARGVGCIYVPGPGATEEPHRTGEFQALLSRTGLITKRSVDTKFIGVRDVLDGRVHIGRGAGIQMWLPTEAKLRRSQGLTRVPGFSYRHLICLFVHTELACGRFTIADAVCRLWVAAWSAIKCNPARTVQALLQEPHYLRAYRLSAV